MAKQLKKKGPKNLDTEALLDEHREEGQDQAKKDKQHLDHRVAPLVAASPLQEGDRRLPPAAARRRIRVGIALPHGATGQQPQLERPRRPDYQYCGSPKQCGEQKIQTERNAPVNPEERGVCGVQVLQNENQHDDQGEDGDGNESP